MITSRRRQLNAKSDILFIVKNIREILRLTTHMRKHFVVITITSILGALVGFVTPFITKFATDWIVKVTTGHEHFSFGPLIVLIVAMIVASLVSVIITDIGGWHGDVMAVKVRRQLSKRYYEHLLRLPQSYYDNEVTGKIINRLSRAISDITQFLQFFSNNLLQMLLTITITIVILLWYSPLVALIFVLLIPANLYLTARTSGSWQAFEKEKNTHFDIASGRFAEVVGQMRLVKSFDTMARELNIFDRHIAKMIGITKKQSKQWHTMNALRQTVFGLIFAAIYGVLFFEAAHGKVSIGDMVMMIALIGRVSFPLRNLSFFVDNYQRAVANSRDYLEALAEEPEPEDAARKKLTVGTAHIQFEDVSFSYNDKKQVISDVSFEISPGQKVALVGESGGGKTTISNLLMRLYAPNSGQILIDGQNIEQVSRRSLRQNIATVFQDPALFSGTIRENIAYANPKATDEQIEKAAKAANAYGFIAKLENGFDTEIGERGIKLSGGQKQRIAIARAVLKDAPILILDEATSSLDSRAEHEVQDALDRLMKGRSVLIIAHRLSTIANVDAIVTLKNGRVDEIGSPSQLAKTGGIYAQLLELQLATNKRAKDRLKAFDMTV